MPLVFTPEPGFPGDPQSMGSMRALIGTLTVSGSYATGGDTFAAGKDLTALFKRTGMGKVMNVDLSRGLTGEWVPTTLKLILYISGATEMGAGAYAAGYTASPIPIMVIGR